MKAILTTTIICVIMYAFIAAEFRNSDVRLGVEIRELTKEYNTIINTTKTLEAQIADICSMNNLKRIAKEQGFSKPTEEQIIHIQK